MYGRWTATWRNTASSVIVFISSIGENGAPPSRLVTDSTAVAPGANGVSGHGESINDSRRFGLRLLMHVSIGDGTCRIGLLSGLIGGDNAAMVTSIGSGPGKVSRFVFGKISFEFDGTSTGFAEEFSRLESGAGASIGNGVSEESEIFSREVSRLDSEDGKISATVESMGNGPDRFSEDTSGLGSGDGAFVGSGPCNVPESLLEERYGLEPEEGGSICNGSGKASESFSDEISGLGSGHDGSTGNGPDIISTSFSEEASSSEYGGGAMSLGEVGNKGAALLSGAADA